MSFSRIFSKGFVSLEVFLVLVLFLLSFFGVFLINNERLDITGMVINPPQGVFGFNLEDLGCSLSLGDCVLVYPRVDTYVSEKRPNSAGADGLYLYVGNSGVKGIGV